MIAIVHNHDHKLKKDCDLNLFNLRKKIQAFVKFKSTIDIYVFFPCNSIYILPQSSPFTLALIS